MEKGMNWKENGLWVIRDFDNILYLCNRKPYKNFHDEGDFVWGCEGDFIKLTDPRSFRHFENLKYTDNPVEVFLEDPYQIKEIEKPDNK